MNKVLILCTLLCLHSAAVADFGSIRITGATILDSGGLDSSSPFQTIDTAKGSCLTEDQVSEEPFFDTIVNFDVENTTPMIFRVNAVRFVLRLTDGRRLRSKRISPLESFDIYPETTGSIKSFFLKATDGFKYFYRAPYEQIVENGFKNVKFILSGKTADNRARKISAKSAVSFDNIDRCE